MSLIFKKIKNKSYYYSFLSYFLIDKPKSFSKYIGAKKPSAKGLRRIENSFRSELIRKISNRNYSASLISKDDVIKTLLFRELFQNRYRKLNELGRRKYDIGSTISFTLTTLTTEEVDVDITDVRNAFKKNSRLNDKEQISKNMLNAIDSIKHKHKLDKEYLLGLHKTIMASFEKKTPGRFRNRQVYIKRRDEYGIGAEISYRPPNYNSVSKLLDEFLEWYNSSNLNPMEKAALAHYKLYRIHPFLDGNKRICRLVFNKTLIDGDFPLINISFKKEKYFNALAGSMEKKNPALFVGFCLSQYYAQVKDFVING